MHVNQHFIVIEDDEMYSISNKIKAKNLDFLYFFIKLINY
ncbi:hypothetical protein CLOSPI_01737 [Thomasclavelia spiroformis DSM 1552]|uniref:Uncharacterized protein n=1 Tax=Thomasclavelia spiroformis DSM 1552 TaxID=428126 RepID=B1C3C1_9FIRM|nr:hypothetical protein CLOSPI_01737 [Thomasclavelia spiroformis DSM 1552]